MKILVVDDEPEVVSVLYRLPFCAGPRGFWDYWWGGRDELGSKAQLRCTFIGCEAA